MNTSLTELRLGGQHDAVKDDIISMRLIAARTNANAALQKIISGEQMVDYADRKKQTALHLAADAGSVMVAQRLMAPELNAQRDLRNFRSLTPLHCAVEARDAPMITVLLSGFDVDLTVPDHVGDTCLQSTNHLLCCQFFLAIFSIYARGCNRRCNAAPVFWSCSLLFCLF